MALDMLKEYRAHRGGRRCTIMKHTGPQKYGTYLRMLSLEEIEKLLACVLHEMRRRDVEHLKRDVLNHGKAALQRVRVDD